MDNKRNQIREKIMKLLALAGNNPSEEESMSALKKAQELMVEYKISEKEVSEQDKDKKCISRQTKFGFTANSSDHYISELADIIADNFCCITYLSRHYGGRTRYIEFMGYEEDVELAIEAMTLANLAIVRGYNDVYKDLQERYEVGYVPASLFNPHKVGYVNGYLKGLKDLFDSQKEKNEEWALVLVAPQEATDFRDGLDTWSCYSPKSNRRSNDYYDQGYSDGQQFNMNKRLDG